MTKTIIQKAGIKTRITSLAATAVIYPMVALCTAAGVAGVAHSTPPEPAVVEVGAAAPLIPGRTGGLFRLEPGA